MFANRVVSTMTYLLSARDSHSSVLEVTQGDYAKVADGQRRYKETLEGDDAVLHGIKRLAEEQVQPQPAKNG